MRPGEVSALVAALWAVAACRWAVMAWTSEVTAARTATRAAARACASAGDHMGQSYIMHNHPGGAHQGGSGRQVVQRPPAGYSHPGAQRRRVGIDRDEKVARSGDGV